MATDIIFTALPNGRDADGHLLLAVHVTPRLTSGDPDPRLASFPELVSWPPTDLQFVVEFESQGVTVPGEVISQPDSSLWQALFNPQTTRVLSKKFGTDAFEDLSKVPVHTYPITRVARWLKDVYTRVAIESPEDGPEIDDLFDRGFGDIRFDGREGRRDWDNASEWLAERLGGDGVVDTRQAPPDPAARYDFFQLKEFFQPLNTDDPEIEALFRENLPEPTLDFHAAVKFCGQHPTLLRLLGLAFDLRIQDEGISSIENTRIRVVAKSQALGSVNVRNPWTHSSITAERFVPRPRVQSGNGWLMNNGFLRLDDVTQFEPIVIDAQGGGLKAIDFAGNLGSRKLRPTEGSPTRLRLPSLRADGLAVALKGNAKLLKEALERSKDQVHDLSAGDLELWAEDLVRGYRIDVWDNLSKQWHSLMHRQGHYKVAGDHEVVVEDEAFLAEATTRYPNRRDLFQPESLFGWDGWSLAVERPGKTHSDEVGADSPPLVTQPESAPAGFDARFKFGLVKGTLPRMRYGSRYRFRARTVDLAGNSVPANSEDDAHATKEILFGRFEPLQSPPVELRTPCGPGESVEVVVLRSNFDADPLPDSAQRHITPAKVSQRTIEFHGGLDVLDSNNQTVIDKSAYDSLASRDTANLFNHPDAQIDTRSRIDPDGAKYYDVDQLKMTWAADPGASGFAIRVLEGPNAGFLKVYPFHQGQKASWENQRCARLVLVEGAEEPRFNETDRCLVVPLRKGDLVRARLSAVVPADGTGQFGLWQWISEGATSDQSTHLKSLIDRGQHWMFEPFRVLTLIHAVRQPLLRPEFPVIGAGRTKGSSWAKIRFDLRVSWRSTSKMDMLASWREPLDEGPGTGIPQDVDAEGCIRVERATAFVTKFDHRTPEPADDLLIRQNGRHEFGDTRHRMVTYRGVATSRYGEFFTERDEFAYHPDDGVIVLDTGGESLVPGSIKLAHYPPSPNPEKVATHAQHLVEDEHFAVDAAAGQITLNHEVLATLDQKPLDGDVITLQYLLTPITRETPDPPDASQGEIGPRRIEVPSSARPHAPGVRYVLPTFGWESNEQRDRDGPTERTSTRRGNGVRIYLDRPWWSSGEGELLGVVTWPPAELADTANRPELGGSAEGDEDLRRQYVTDWGHDPVYASAQLPSRYPRLSAFAGAIKIGQDLTLKEFEGHNGQDLLVNVAGHRVAYDADRDLWFCDIDVQAGNAYMPFIRFALARYQPSSIPGAHLSPVVLADFIQLAPDRFVTITKVRPGRTGRRVANLQVALAGPVPVSNRAIRNSPPGTAQVIVQRRNSDIPGELGWEDEGAPITMRVDETAAVKGQGLWIADVHVPGGEDSFRVVIEQFELIGEDAASAGRSTLAPRLVHTDIIDL